MHVRSSQAFAINLFAPLTAEGPAKLLTDFFGPVNAADPPVFEFEDNADRLGESTSKRPHRTQVDVLLRGTAVSGQPVALLIEVKLTEDDFGHCSAYTNPDNDRRDVCARPGPFGSNQAACFQLRNNGNGPRRKYDEYLATIAEHDSGCGCSFRLSASQPMRNLALAGVLEADGADVKFALCAPSAHRAIWRRWDTARAALNDERMVDLPAEHVVATHNGLTATWLTDRYQLGPAIPSRVATSREWATWAVLNELVSRYKQTSMVIETHPGGGQYDCVSLHDSADEVVLHMNRAGRVHINSDGELVPIEGVWELCRRVGPAEAADRIAGCLHVQTRRIAVETPWNQFASTVREHLDAGHNVHWLNGMLDSSGNEGGVREHLYEAAGIRVPVAAPDRPWLDHPAYRDWFCVDSAGTVLQRVAIEP
jgi:hypothetical protein